MEVVDNESGGQSVLLSPADKLTAVPKSHRNLVTKEIRPVFGDASDYFGRIADKTPSPNMAKWLRALLREDRWLLVLHGSPWSKPRAGFKWRSEVVRGAEIGLPTGDDTRRLPRPLAGVFQHVGLIDWSGYGVGGGLIGFPRPLASWRPMGPPAGERSQGIDWESPHTLGWGGFNGACLFATADDRAGWVSLSGEVSLLGTVAEAVEWWFGRMLADKSPTMDYVWEVGNRGEVA